MSFIVKDWILLPIKRLNFLSALIFITNNCLVDVSAPQTQPRQCRGFFPQRAQNKRWWASYSFFQPELGEKNQLRQDQKLLLTDFYPERLRAVLPRRRCVAAGCFHLGRLFALSISSLLFSPHLDDPKHIYSRVLHIWGQSSAAHNWIPGWRNAYLLGPLLHLVRHL